MQDIQYQERTDTLTDRDILDKLPHLVDLQSLTDDQRKVLEIHKQKSKLLSWLVDQEIEQRQMLQRQQSFNVSDSDIQQTRLRLETLQRNVKQAADDLLLFEKEYGTYSSSDVVTS